MCDARIGIPSLLEQRVERRGETRGARVELRLQRGPLRLEVCEHGARGGHRQRVLAEGAGEVGGLGARVRVRRRTRQKPPSMPSMKRRAAGDDADRQAAADDLAVGGEVGCDAELRLRAAGMHAETGHHLVEDQHDAGCLRERAQLVQELARLELGAAALHRLDEDRGQFVGACVR